MVWRMARPVRGSRAAHSGRGGGAATSSFRSLRGAFFLAYILVVDRSLISPLVGCRAAHPLLDHRKGRPDEPPGSGWAGVAADVAARVRSAGRHINTFGEVRAGAVVWKNAAGIRPIYRDV